MRTVLAFLIGCVTTVAVAQQPADPVEQGRADIVTGRMGMVASAMTLTPEQEEVFWPLYREYVEEQVKLLDERIAMLSDFSANYEHMTPEKARSIAERSFAIQRARTARREKYFEIFAEALDPILAARFIQVDSQIATLMDFELNKSTPLFVAPVDGD